MHKIFARAIAAFVPGKKRRKSIRRRLQPDWVYENTGNRVRIKNGDEIYMPMYIGRPTCLEPDIYNAKGEKIRTVYIRDVHTMCDPPFLTNGHLFFDRYNYALKNHFYTHQCMLQKCGTPERRYGALWESKGITPQDYLLFTKHKSLHEDFDYIFTWDADILEHVPNARYVPFCAGIRLDFSAADRGVSLATETEKMIKTKNLSMLSSNKTICDLHNLRIDLALRLSKSGLADVYGTVLGKSHYVRAFDTVAPYRFSVIVENEISPYFFTEKIVNCFACKTIPIYIGASQIHEFFNPDGIISIHPNGALDTDRIVKMATATAYSERLAAVEQNYARALSDYVNPLNMMYEKYLKDNLR